MLQASLAAAQTRQREHEALSSDLTHALQQQKGALAGLQRDKQELARQLQRCTPKEFDRLHSDLLAAKRQAAELVLVHEQLERQRAMWSDAEQRLSELQVGSGHTRTHTHAARAGASWRAVVCTCLPHTVAVPAWCLQASTARAQEESAGKQASLAAQLNAARDELAALQAERKQLQQQLSSAQDAVKVCMLR